MGVPPRARSTSNQRPRWRRTRVASGQTIGPQRNAGRGAGCRAHATGVRSVQHVLEQHVRPAPRRGPDRDAGAGSRSGSSQEPGPGLCSTAPHPAPAGFDRLDGAGGGGRPHAVWANAGPRIDEAQRPRRPSWTEGGEPLPLAPYDDTWLPPTGRAPSCCGLYEQSLRIFAYRVSEAAIPVDRIAGRVLDCRWRRPGLALGPVRQPGARSPSRPWSRHQGHHELDCRTPGTSAR